VHLKTTVNMVMLMERYQCQNRRLRTSCALFSEGAIRERF